LNHREEYNRNLQPTSTRSPRSQPTSWRRP